MDRRAAPQEIGEVEAAKVTIPRPVLAYLDQLDDGAALPQKGPPHKPPKAISEADPQAAWSIKDGPRPFIYETNYLVDD